MENKPIELKLVKPDVADPITQYILKKGNGDYNSGIHAICKQLMFLEERMGIKFAPNHMKSSSSPFNQVE